MWMLAAKVILKLLAECERFPVLIIRILATTNPHSANFKSKKLSILNYET